MTRVLLDANVFVTFWTLDVLLALAEAGLYEPVWSQAVCPVKAVEPLGIRAIHPDAFLCSLYNREPEVVRRAVADLTQQKKHPPRTMAEELAGLRRNRLFKFADLIDVRP